MNVLCIILAFSSISDLVLLQKTGNSDSVIDEMKRNMTVLMNTVDRMQSVLNEQAFNISQQQSQLRTIELENKLMNRTIEMQQELLLNQTLAMSSQKAGVEADKQFITRLEEEVNKTIGAYNIILNDVVNTLNTYRNENERNVHNFTVGMRNIENQFHYVSLSTLGTVKQLTDLNTSLHKLENQQLDMNASTAFSISGIKHQIQYLNTTALHSNLDIGNIRKSLGVLNSSIQVPSLTMKELCLYMEYSKASPWTSFHSWLSGSKSAVEKSFVPNDNSALTSN